MRLGEIKNILDKIVENDKIVIDSEAKYNNQAYSIFNFKDLLEGLEILKKQEWNSWDYNFLDEYYESINKNSSNIIVSTQKYNLLNQYINNLNTKFPIFYQMLSSFVEPQEEYLINIKMPNDLSLDKLSNINKELNTLFKEINADAEFKFAGFDIGTNWYKILVIGSITYNLFLGGIDIGTKLFQMRTEFYKSEIEKQHYLASLKDNETYNEKDFKEYIEKFIKLQIASQVDNIVSRINIKNNNENEIKGKLLKASEKIAEQLENGIEFHLSLNPPEYVSESDNGSFEIDYEEIRKIQEEQNKPKEITDKSKENETNEE